MLVVKRPTAIIFDWKEPGLYNYISEKKTINTSSYGWVDIHSYQKKDIGRWQEIFLEIQADVVIFIGQEIFPPFEYYKNKIITFYHTPTNDEIIDSILDKVTEHSCLPYFPKFSVFTPAYKTGNNIYKTFEHLKKQTISDWEWVIVDDSPEDHSETWEILKKISSTDPRVKIHRINPNSNGFVGKVKKRACLLSCGEWLVELDHDDYLIENCLEQINNASLKYTDAEFIYSDCTEVDYDEGKDFRFYYDYTGDDYYAKEDNSFNFGYSGNTWEIIGEKKYLKHHYPNINPITIRFNISMPNHVRAWKREFYLKIGGHSEVLPVADDYELIIRTFLKTRIIHIKKLLYAQMYRLGSTVDQNSFEINRRSRLIRDFYDLKIHERIKELGFYDWEWCEETKKCKHQDTFYNKKDIKYFEEEQVLNYIYE